MGWRLRVLSIFLLGITISYLLAKAGEPQSAWLWGF